MNAKEWAGSLTGFFSVMGISTAIFGFEPILWAIMLPGLFAYHAMHEKNQKEKDNNETP